MDASLSAVNNDFKQANDRDCKNGSGVVQIYAKSEW
jgi:hypothetical protein